MIEVPLLGDAHTPNIPNNARTKEDLNSSEAEALAMATVLCRISSTQCEQAIMALEPAWSISNYWMINSPVTR